MTIVIPKNLNILKNILPIIILLLIFTTNKFCDCKEDSKEKSIVFNVWEYARVVGRPLPAPTRTTTTSESPQQAAESSVNQISTISPCVWAITSCCQAKDVRRRHDCFEALGCPGAWFNDMCSLELRKAALDIISEQMG